MGGDLLKIDGKEVKVFLKKGMKEEGYKKLLVIMLIYSIDDMYKKIVEVLQ